MMQEETMKAGKLPLAELGNVQEAAERLASAIASAQDIPSVEYLLYAALQAMGRPLAIQLPISLRNYEAKQIVRFIKGTQGLPLRLIALFSMEKGIEAAEMLKTWLEPKLTTLDAQEAVKLLGETVQIGAGLRLQTLVRTVVAPLFQKLDLNPLLLYIWQNRDLRLCNEVLSLGYFCSIENLMPAVSSSFQALFSSKTLPESIESVLVLDPLFSDCPEISFSLRKSLSQKINTSDGIREFSAYFHSLLVKGSVPSPVFQLFLLVSNKDLFEQLYRKDTLLRVLEGSNTELEREALEAISALAPPGIFQRSRALLLDLSLSEDQR
jgi:hypothetical protein